MILHKNLHYLYGSPSTVRAEHVARQIIQEIHADYFWGNLLVNINLEDPEGDEKTLKWILGE
jgi:ATP-dependent helicase/DNAse subunit B